MISKTNRLIDRNSLSINKDRIASVLRAPILKNISEVGVFPGMINYYSKLIPIFANIMTPLCKFLKKSKCF